MMCLKFKTSHITFNSPNKDLKKKKEILLLFKKTKFKNGQSNNILLMKTYSTWETELGQL